MVEDWSYPVLERDSYGQLEEGHRSGSANLDRALGGDGVSPSVGGRPPIPPIDDWGDLEPLVDHDLSFPEESGIPEIHIPPMDPGFGADDDEPPAFMLEEPQDEGEEDFSEVEPLDRGLAVAEAPAEEPEAEVVKESPKSVQTEQPEPNRVVKEGAAPELGVAEPEPESDLVVAPVMATPEPAESPKAVPAVPKVEGLTARSATESKLSHLDAARLLLGSAVTVIGHPPGGGREKVPLTHLAERPKEVEPVVAHDKERPLRVQKPPLPDETPRIRAEDVHHLLPGPGARKSTSVVEVGRTEIEEQVLAADMPSGMETTQVQASWEQPEEEKPVVERRSVRPAIPQEMADLDLPTLVPRTFGVGTGPVLGRPSEVSLKAGGEPERGQGHPEAEMRPGSAKSLEARLVPWGWVIGAALVAGALGGVAVLWLGGGLSAEQGAMQSRGEERNAQDGLRRKRVVLEYLDGQKQVMEDRMVVLEGDIEIAARDKDWNQVLVLEREKQSLVGLVQAVEARKRLLLEGGR